MKRFGAMLAFCIPLFLGACGGNGGFGGMGPKQTIGGLGGAALGGLVGSQFGHGTGKLIATGAGVFLGAILGSEIGRYMDEADQRAAYGSAQNALEYEPDGGRSDWQNPNTGHSGWTEPTRTWQDNNGSYCREYQTTVVINGHSERAYGTACRQPDGSWKIEN